MVLLSLGIRIIDILNISIMLKWDKNFKDCRFMYFIIKRFLVLLSLR